MEAFVTSPRLLLFLAMLLSVLHWAPVSEARDIHSFLNENFLNSSKSQNAKKWAVLVAGSKGFTNYRHQADVCHAYQILKAGGLQDENIIVFMYDDIANNPENRKPGVILNRINGPNVYPGVPKVDQDYTGDQATKANFYCVLLGMSRGVTGGSGKVLDSGPDDHVFIYYADHGSPGRLTMPDGDSVYASEFVNALKIKHQSNAYSQMVIYVEACESGSIFDGLLPEDLNVYATTSANPTESSYSCYHDPGLNAFLGDSYSVSWMEDSEARDPSTETLDEQYEAVKKRTGDKAKFGSTSHVMQYGTKKLGSCAVGDFIGSRSPKTKNYSPRNSSTRSHFIPQRDVELYLLHQKLVASVASEVCGEGR
uniref:legumain n=1 Tax=Kalanchoe fedtschenkoi TaxID=63787 RepID=A0A7N0U932_KALFE